MRRYVLPMISAATLLMAAVFVVLVQVVQPVVVIDRGDAWPMGTFHTENLVVDNTSQFSGNMTVTTVDPANHSQVVTHTLSGGTTSVRAIYGLEQGTANTTAGALTMTAIRGEANVSRSAGAGTLTNNGVLGVAANSPVSNYALHAIVQGASGSDNRGVQVENTSTSSSLNYGVHVLVNGVAPTNIGIKIGAVGGTINRALECSDGDVVLNSQSGSTTLDGNVIVLGGLTGSAGLVQLGVGGSREVRLVEKHNTQPTFTSCGSGPTITGADTAMTIVTGTGATACTISFVTAWPNPPTCIPFVRDGTAITVGTVTTSSYPITSIGASKTVDIHCIGH